MNHIFEHAGVMFDVTYQQDDPPTFQSVHVLGADYQPTGPNLLPLLHDMAILERNVDADAVQATRFLSAIVEELP